MIVKHTTFDGINIPIMKPTKANIIGYLSAFCMILLLNACRVEKNDYKILKNSKPDTTNRQNNFGSIKNSGRMKKIDRDGFLFDEYIANDFHLPKKKRDSAAIVNYFKEASFAQLGRREFRQWDVVVVRGVAFQINVGKNNDDSRLHVFGTQSRIELMGMIIMLLGFYFL